MLLHKLSAMQILFPFLSPLFVQIFVMKWFYKKMFSDEVYSFLWLWSQFPFNSHTKVKKWFLHKPNFYKNMPTFSTPWFYKYAFQHTNIW